MNIRPTTEADRPDLCRIHLAAFGPEQGDEIAALVCDLLDDATAEPRLSLVAASEGQLIGHVLYTNVRLPSAGQAIAARILAPLAVVPDWQGQGIGSQLIVTSCQQLQTAGVDLVFVLGYPDYYGRFGFQAAGALGLAAPYPIPDADAEAWMVQALRPGVLGRVSGTIQCASSLQQPQHWLE